MIFETKIINSTCSFLINQEEWHGANVPVLIELFKSTIEEFNTVVNVSPQRQLLIQPAPGFDNPMCSRTGDHYTVFLTSRGNHWCQYLYQFAHEYCHFLIDGPMDGEMETTFWFEESICELASLFFMNRAFLHWQGWKSDSCDLSLSNSSPCLLLKLFAPYFKEYFDKLITQNQQVERQHLSVWINDNMQFLSEPKYHRNLYNQIACALYPLFCESPDLWSLLPYLKRPNKEEYLGFVPFIQETLKERVRDKVNSFSVFEHCLVGSA